MRAFVIAFALLGASLVLFGAANAADADAALNATYKALMSRLDSANQARLRTAQRAWIAFRDSECAFRSQGGDAGSIGPTVTAACVAELSAARTQQLKAQLDCPEGDVACVPRERAAAANSAPEATEVACSQSAGPAKAATLVKQCLEVSPATHPPCNAANACDLIVDEITRSCAMIDHGAPAFCAQYPAAGH